MIKQKTIITLVAITFGYIALKAYNIFKSIDIEFTAINISNAFSSPQLFATFTIKNPTNFAVKISSISGVLYADGEFLANIKTMQAFEITKYSATITDLYIEPTIKSVTNFIGNFLIGNKKVVSFVGNIYIMGIPFKIDQILPI
jgi:LEA14-like dessication related protein